MQPVTAGMGAADRGVRTVPQPRLVHAAHEFEAQMMKELLEPMTRSQGLLGGEDDAEGSTGTLGAYASESLALALSERGGLGIANRIIARLSHSGNRPTSGEVTGKLQGSTTLRTSK